jgi:uncharacterized protein (TIGR00661 family)
MKILYAASNNENAGLTLSRFVKHIPDEYQLKIAAYKKSSPPNLSIDWTLDCLLNLFRPDLISIDDNDNLEIFYDQIKYFNPDLIISDLEYFTSYIANQLNIPLWQVSPSLIPFALTHEEKYNLGIFKNYSYLTNRNPLHNQRTLNIINNSDLNLVYSHLGDVDVPPQLKDNFQWVRPYHALGKRAMPCAHNIVGVTLSNNKRICRILQHYPDTVLFTNFKDEKYSNISLKMLTDEEYYCNLSNSYLFICEGQMNFLADAYYNNKFSVVCPNFQDLESLITATTSEKLKFSVCIYNDRQDLSEFMNVSIGNTLNTNIKYLHERLKDL